MYKNIVAKIDSNKEIVEEQLNNYYNLRIQAINYFQSHHIQIPDMMNQKKGNKQSYIINIQTETFVLVVFNDISSYIASVINATEVLI